MVFSFPLMPFIAHPSSGTIHQRSIPLVSERCNYLGCVPYILCSPHRELSFSFSQRPQAKTFLPFGGGARMCIGHRFAMLEMKAALAHMIRKFHITADETKPLVPKQLFTLQPATGVHVFLARRPAVPE
eukprot:m.599940 g.599940  ORF g.599940 m.599940 type:complete len:129 (-) comp58079_c0_seq39:2335-2721(-)